MMTMIMMTELVEGGRDEMKKMIFILLKTHFIIHMSTTIYFINRFKVTHFYLLVYV